MNAGNRRLWLFGAVMLVVLALKALMVTSIVAGTVEDAAVDALADQGLSSVRFVEVDGVGGIGGDGVDVVLEGPAEDESAAVAAVSGRDEIAAVIYRPIAATGDTATGDTATGDTGSGDGASGDAVSGDASDAGDAGETEDEKEPAPAAALDPGSVELAVAADLVTVTGVVADEAARGAVLAEATARFGAANVVDELVTGPVAEDNGTVVITGAAASETQRSEWVELADAVAAGQGYAVESKVEVSSVTSVEDRLNELFVGDPIEFDIARAEIRPESLATLDAAAEVINATPDGPRLRIVGHTDGDGLAAANLELSNARANAVLAYLVDVGGVDPDRVVAEGRGETEPAVQPETSREDKQRNRRIEWEPIQ